MDFSKVKYTLTVGHIEGISYLVLLFIAMPLKYVLDLPQAVRWVGMIHGLLFVAYVGFIIDSWARMRWKPWTGLGLFVMSLVPFGTFFQKKVIRSVEGK